MIGLEEAANLTDIPNIRQKGTRLGNWLTREQAKELLTVPDRSTLKGKRDYVILALLVGSALRRNEVAELLEQPDAKKMSGRRDMVLLSLMYDSGARVQEMADISVG
jgi:site-specific recombinase XerD